MKLIILFILLIFLNGCSEFAILMSGASVAASQNVYSKVYSGADIITIISTNKSIKKHAYEKFKEKQ